MKRLLYVFPILFTLVMVSCSEEAPEEKEDTTKQEQEASKPLIERDEEVKDYFETMNEMIEEYLNVGETMLSTLENLDKGEVGLLEYAGTVQSLLESWEKIDELDRSINQQEDLKTTIERRLNAKDIAEFTAMYSETIQRCDSLAKRIENSDLQKYLK